MKSVAPAVASTKVPTVAAASGTNRTNRPFRPFSKAPSIGCENQHHPNDESNDEEQDREDDAYVHLRHRFLQPLATSVERRK
jgi:hypothetical protein